MDLSQKYQTLAKIHAHCYAFCMRQDMTALQKPWVLASSSQPRAELLSRLGKPFETVSPDIDESPLPGESITQQVERLSVEKALAVGKQKLHALIIAGDQLASLDGKALGKPGDFDAAFAQLQQLSDQRVTFYAGIALYCPETETMQCEVVPTEVKFKPLEADTIRAYLNADQPFACAASFKSESLGSCLTETMRSDDPSALIGLPLIALTEMLENLG